MEFASTQHEVGPVVLHPSGEIDYGTVLPLRDSIRAALGSGTGGLIVSLEDVSFLDSAGLGVLVGAYKRAVRADVPFHIVCAHERVWKGFRITGLDKVLNVHTSMAAALAAVAIERGWDIKS